MTDLPQRNGKFWAERLDLRLDGWESYRDTVSRELDDRGDWQGIARAFEAMRAVQGKCAALRPKFGERPGLGPRSHEVIAEYLARSDLAIAALERLSCDRPADEPVIDDDTPRPTRPSSPVARP
jgi:hypothetical protein